MKKSTVFKTILKVIIVAVVLALAAGIIWLFITNSYKPSEDELNIVNMASLSYYNSEVSADYTQKGTKRIDGKRRYVFEFTLEKGGEKVRFAFDKDVTETNFVYTLEDNNWTLVVLPTAGGEDFDNDAEWPEEWNDNYSGDSAEGNTDGQMPPEDLL